MTGLYLFRGNTKVQCNSTHDFTILSFLSKTRGIRKSASHGSCGTALTNGYFCSEIEKNIDNIMCFCFL